MTDPRPGRGPPQAKKKGPPQAIKGCGVSLPATYLPAFANTRDGARTQSALQVKSP